MSLEGENGFTAKEIDDLQKKSKERTVRTQNIEYDIETLVGKIGKGQIKLDPDYQRNHRWDPAKSSRLIESLILNIPIPIIYISYDIDLDIATEEVRYSVIDGQQRLRAISDYFNNTFSLEGLDTLAEINGISFSDLPTFLRRRLEARTIRCIQVDSTVDEQVKFDIFERLNIGSVKLEPQEIRNATVRGKFNDTIKELSLYQSFNTLLQIGDIRKRDQNIRVQKMEDRELVLRFMAFSDDFASKDLSNITNFLTDKMKDLNQASDDLISEKADDFKSVMDIALREFGDTAFAKLKPRGTEYIFASRFNVAVYDALSQVLLINMKRGKTSYSARDKAKYKSLFNDEEFIDSISGGTNLKSRIELRIRKVAEAIS